MNNQQLSLQQSPSKKHCGRKRELKDRAMTVRDLMLIDDSETPPLSMQSKKRVKRSERDFQDCLMEDTEN